jgi:hypothetical protein
MQTPGRIKISSYHAHEFYKMIKKCDNDLYTACPCKCIGDAGPSKWEVMVVYYLDRATSPKSLQEWWPVKVRVNLKN